MPILKTSTDFQMQEIISRCEDCLMLRKGDAQTLFYAQLYNLERLKEKCVNALRTTPSSFLLRDSFFQKIDPETKIEVFTAKCKMLEERSVKATKKQKSLEVRFSEFLKLFSDVKTSVVYTGEQEDMVKQKVWNRAAEAMEELLKEEPANLKAYSEPEIKEEIQKGGDEKAAGGEENSQAG